MHLRKTDKSEYSSTLMLWEGNRQIQEYTNHHIFTTVYDQDSFEPVARIVQARNPIESDKSQETFKVYHYHNNHLGTPQELTDDDGNVVWANYEWAWGGSYQSYYQEQSLNHIAIDKDHLQPLRFQGQFFDSETSLHYNRFRYYDSDVGMFIQRDPIGLLGGVNVFAYAPNPIHWVDPWGLARSKKTKPPYNMSHSTCCSCLTGLVYRVIRDDEDPSKGLFAKDPTRTHITIHGHVARGSTIKTPYISASKTYKKAVENSRACYEL